MQIHFDITGDNSSFIQSMEEVQQKADKVYAVFNRLGKDGFDIKGGAEANVKLLSQRIDALSDSAEKSRATINRWAQEATEALGNGDVQGFRVINEDIQEESKNLQELTAEVEEYKAVLDTLKSYQGGELVGNTDKMENVRMRMRQLTQEVANYTIELSRMTEEERNSAKGQELQKKLNQAKQEAGELKDVMGDVNREINAIASDTGNFDALAEGIDLVSSGFGAAAGFAAMFGVEEERLEEIQTTLQASLAISNALSVVQNNLQAESAIMGKVRATQDLASAAAIKIKAAAEGKGVIATKAATAAQWAFNAVAKANPYVLLAAAIVSVVGALYYLTNRFKESTEAEKKAQQEAEALNRKLAEIKQRHEEQTAAAAGVEVQYLRLQTEWKKLKTLSEKNQWIKNNQSAFKALGSSITSVNDAENYLVRNSRTVIQALLRRAIAAKQAEQAAEELVNMRKGKSSAITVKYGKVKAGDDYGQISDAEANALTRRGIAGKGGKLTQAGADEIMRMRAQNAAKQSQQNLAEWNKREKEIIKDYEQAILDGLAAESTLKKFNSPETTSATKTTSAKKTTTDNAAVRQQHLADLQAKQAQETERKKAKAIIDAREYTLQARSDSTQAEIDSINLAYDKEKQAIQQATEDAISAHEKAARELWEAQNPKAAEKGQTWLNTGRQGRTFNLTPEEQQALDARTLANERQRNKALADIYDRENQIRIDYLKKFGDYAQQANALYEEYAKKRQEIIDRGGNTYELAQNDAELQEALGNSRMESLKEEINWEEVFSNLDYVSTDHLKRLREQLRAALDMGDITAENARIITEKLNEIDKQIQQKRSTWGQLFGDANQGIGGIVNAIRDQQALNADAAKKREEAITASGIASALRLTAEGIKTDKGEDSEEYLKAQRKADEAGKDAQKKNQAAEIAEGLAGNGSLAMTGAIIHGVNDNVQSFAEAAQLLGGKDSEFAKSATKFAESSQYATDGFEKFKQGDFIGAALSVGKAVNSLGETFGLWSNSNVEDVQKENKRLAAAMALNTQAIERLTKKMGEGDTVNAAKNYEEAMAVMKQNEALTKQMLINTSTMYDGHHSTAYKFNDERKGTLKGLNEILGTNYGSLQDVLSGDIATLNKLYETEAGRQALKSFTEAISWAESEAGMENNALAEQFTAMLQNFNADAYKEIERAFQTAITGMSFESFKSNFKSALMDMQKDSKDFADDFTKQLTQSFLNAQIEDAFADRIEELYDEWGEAIKGNVLDEGELRSLRSKQEALVNEMIAKRDEIAAITGYDDVSTSEASGSINSAKSMSEDTANELIGRMTAVQIAVEGIRSQDNVMTQQVINGVTALMSITSVSASNNEVLNAILLQHVQSNSYLEDISKSNKAMYSEWGSQINAIRTKIDTL